MTTESMRNRDVILSPEGYRPDFLERFSNAVAKPPIQGVLFENPHELTPVFANVLEAANIECLKEQICEHGLDHAIRVVQNGFFLRDLILAEVRNGNPAFAQDGRWEEIFDDSSLAFFLLTHDIGYGMGDLRWQDKYALNYQERSAAFLDTLASSVSDTESANVFRQYYPIYRETVVKEAKDIFFPKDKAPKRPPYSPEDVLVLVHDLANYLEFFRAQRLEGLLQPKTYEENRYYWLTKKVSDYELTSGENTVWYSLAFDTNVVIHKLPDFAIWYQQAQQEAPVMWQLLQVFEELTRKKFVCRGEKT